MIEWGSSAKADLLDILQQTDNAGLIGRIIDASEDCAWPPGVPPEHGGELHDGYAWRRALSDQEIAIAADRVEEASTTGSWDFVLLYQRTGQKLVIRRVIPNGAFAAEARRHLG